MDRDFKGVWIPKELFLNETLSWAEKILLIEIDSLDQNGQGCFASNEYLAKFVQLSEGSLANLIVKLMNKGYIIKKGFDGRKRYISVNPDLTKILTQTSQKDEPSLHKNMNSDFIKTLKQRSQKNEHINTISNTDIKPIIKTTIKESKKNFTLVFPPEFSPNLIQKINDFFEHRRQKKKPYKTQMTIQARMDKFEKEVKQYGENIVIASIENCIANNWDGTFINNDLIKQFNNNQNNQKNGNRNYQSEQEIRQRSVTNIIEMSLNALNEQEQFENNIIQSVLNNQKLKS
jgi:hypothetical protein